MNVRKYYALKNSVVCTIAKISIVSVNDRKLSGSHPHSSAAPKDYESIRLKSQDGRFLDGKCYFYLPAMVSLDIKMAMAF